VPGAQHVEFDDVAVALGGDRLGRSRELPAGVVDQYVDPAVPLQHSVEELVHGLVVADVHRGGVR